MKKATGCFLIMAAILAACSKTGSFDKAKLVDKNWYIGAPAAYSSKQPVVFGSDSVYYINTVASGNWAWLNNTDITLNITSGNVAETKIQVLDLRDAHLKYKITESSINAQVGEVLELDLVP